MCVCVRARACVCVCVCCTNAQRREGGGREESEERQAAKGGSRGRSGRACTARHAVPCSFLPPLHKRAKEGEKEGTGAGRVGRGSRAGRHAHTHTHTQPEESKAGRVGRGLGRGAVGGDSEAGMGQVRVKVGGRRVATEKGRKGGAGGRGGGAAALGRVRWADPARPGIAGRCVEVADASGTAHYREAGRGQAGPGRQGGKEGGWEQRGWRGEGRGKRIGRVMGMEGPKVRPMCVHIGVPSDVCASWGWCGGLGQGQRPGSGVERAEAG